MSLSDIIGRTIELYDVKGGIDVHKAVNAAFSLVVDDKDMREQLLREALSKRIKEAATRLRRGEDAENMAQSSFFGDRLRHRYALDIDGRVIKETSSMTRLEFERVIAIREKQLIDDTAQLDVLREARSELSPVWDLYPDFTYGQVEQIYCASKAAA